MAIVDVFDTGSLFEFGLAQIEFLASAGLLVQWHLPVNQ